MPGAAISPSRGEVPQQAQLQEVTDIPGVAILHLRESYLVVPPCQSVQLCSAPTHAGQLSLQSAIIGRLQSHLGSSY
jgi:hypothetical protein